MLRLASFLTHIIILTCLTTPSYAFQINDVPNYTLRYAVNYKNTEIGELEIAVKTTNSKVVVHAETFPNAIAKLVGDGKVVETIEYHQKNDQLVLTRLTERKGSNTADTKELNVDRKNNTINTDSKQSSISTENQIDAYTFPFLSILGVTESNDGSAETLVSVDKVRKFKFHEPVKETLSTQAGSFETVKLSKTQVNKDKTINLWVTESAPIMPIKIQIVRKGKVRTTIDLIKR